MGALGPWLSSAAWAPGPWQKVQRAVSLFSLHEAALSPDPPATPTMSEQLPPGDLPGKVYQLELLLKQLHSDLQKEKEDKAVLQAEVATLRQNNQRLQEESHTASERLRKFAQIFSGTVEEEEEEEEEEL